jgi:predicted DNA-binding protein YlxM (UPF0122 family)
MTFHKVQLLAKKFWKLADEVAPDTERSPNLVEPEETLEIGFKPTPDVFQFLKLLQVMATLKNKLSNHRDLDPYVNFYIRLLIQSKAGIFRNAIKDSISRNVFNFDDYEAVRTMFKQYATENDLAGYLDMLSQTVQNAGDKLNKEDASFFTDSLNFIIKELNKL